MQITLNLPESVAAHLEDQAAQLNVSLDDLMQKIFRDRLAAAPSENVWPISTQNGKQIHKGESIEQVVMRIRATPPNPANIIPSSQSFDEAERLWRANAAEGSDISPAEWDRLWAEFEQEQKRLDWADDRAEGRA